MKMLKAIANASIALTVLPAVFVDAVRNSMRETYEDSFMVRAGAKRIRLQRTVAKIGRKGKLMNTGQLKQIYALRDKQRVEYEAAWVRYLLECGAEPDEAKADAEKRGQHYSTVKKRRVG